MNTCCFDKEIFSVNHSVVSTADVTNCMLARSTALVGIVEDDCLFSEDFDQQRAAEILGQVKANLSDIEKVLADFYSCVRRQALTEQLITTAQCEAKE